MKSKQRYIRMTVLTVTLSICFPISFTEKLLVSVDEEAGEGAVCPERVKEESVLFGVEDLQPDLVFLLQVENSRTRRHIMVPCVCIKCLDLVLSVVHQPNGQVLICKSDIIGEVINSGDGTDELPTAGVVVIPLVQQDPAEADGHSLFRVALCHRHREGRASWAAAVAASRSSFLAHVAQLSLRSPFSSHPRCPTLPLQSTRSSLANNPLTAFYTWLALVPSPPWIT